MHYWTTLKRTILMHQIEAADTHLQIFAARYEALYIGAAAYGLTPPVNVMGPSQRAEAGVYVRGQCGSSPCKLLWGLR